MQEDIPDMDDTGHRKVAQIERALKKMDWDNPGAFLCITNALEFHLEIYPRDPQTIRLLAQALRAFITSRDIDPKSTGCEKALLYLLEYNG